MAHLYLSVLNFNYTQMKVKTILFTLSLLLAGWGVNAQNLRGDGLKSSIVKYELTAQDMEIPMIEYKDDYGKKICSKMTIMGGEIGYIMNGDKSYMINYSQQQYMELERPENKINYNELTPEVIDKYKITATGTGEFLGKKCTIYTSEMTDSKPAIKMTAWVYKGIPLKVISEYDNGTKDQRIATSIEENPVIPASTFEVPQGFTKMALPLMK